MSDMSEGPGWWIASDGKWYPPHLHPSVRVDPPTPGESTGSSSATADVAAEPSSEISGEIASSPAGLKTRRRTPVVATVSVLVVVALVATAFVVFGGSKGANAEVIDAVNNTLGDKTAQIIMNESITTAGKTFTANGTGAMDFTHEALGVQLTATIAGQQVPLEVDSVGGVIYEKIPGLDQIIPGKTWISIDLSSLHNASTSLGDPSAQSAGANPSVMLRALAQQGNTVVDLGPSTLDGVAVHGYAVTVNPSTVSQELKKADLPSWMQQSIVGLKAQNIKLRVFIDTSGLLRSFRFQVTVSTGSSGPVAVDETFGFSHYGTAVNVVAPPADQVESFDQFLQAEQAQSTPAS